MRKIPACDRCHYHANDYHLVCVPRPYGPDGDICPDFSPNPEYSRHHFKDFLRLQQWRDQEEAFSNPFELHPNEEPWEPEGASYYAGELIVQPRQRWTREEQLQLLDTHPIFTGRCPQCGTEYERDYRAVVHWDCPNCGWIDDTV